jgi:hypothetical protein
MNVQDLTEWREWRKRLIATYQDHVLLRDRALASVPKLPIERVIEVLLRTVHTALLIYTGADRATQEDMLWEIKLWYAIARDELPKPIADEIFRVWRDALAWEEQQLAEMKREMN